MEEQQTANIEQKETIDLKMTAKGVSYWDIKLKADKFIEDELKRFEQLTNVLRKQFPKNAVDFVDVGKEKC